MKNSRQNLSQAKRIVVKVGSRLLVNANGRPNLKRLQNLADQLAALRKEGREVILVSSGAVAAGLQTLKMKEKPTNIPDLQMAAAIGQTRLMSIYDGAFQKHKCKTAQILLTHDDLRNRTRHLNARNTMIKLLKHDVIPIVNENDVVSIDEIKFGDNDKLAALVSMLIDADLLILLTSVNGFQLASEGKPARRLSEITKLTANIKAAAGGSGSAVSTGGMATKLEAAMMATKAGISSVIADGRKNDTLLRLVAGDDCGTLLPARQDDASPLLNKRKRWIAYFHKPCGSITIDTGASRALLEKGKSLLPIGIKSIQGSFPKGANLEILNEKGVLLAYGLTDYTSRDIEIIKGKNSSAIEKLLGQKDYDEVVHRDNMVIVHEA